MMLIRPFTVPWTSFSYDGTVYSTCICQYHQHNGDPSHLPSIDPLQILGDDIVPFHRSRSRTSNSISMCAHILGALEDTHLSLSYYVQHKPHLRDTTEHL